MYRIKKKLIEWEFRKVYSKVFDNKEDVVFFRSGCRCQSEMVECTSCKV